MRSIRYRIEVESDSEGYLIYNAETSWNEMPTEDNFKRPSIRVLNESGGALTADIIDNFKLDDVGDVSQDFAKNYIRILQGEVPEWVLAVVQISKLGVSLAFFNRETRKEENLHIECAPYLAVRFEVDRTDDDAVDTYVLRMAAAEDDNRLDYLCVAEYDGCGKHSRDLCFTPTTHTGATKENDGWDYVYVTEYR